MDLTALTARVEALETLVNQNRFNRGAQGPVFVFRPGGRQAANVFTSWATLMAGVNATQGPATIQIDDSIVSPAIVPAGTWNLNGVTLTGVENDSNEFASLTFAQGAQVTFKLAFWNYLEIQSVSTAVVAAISAVAVLITDQTSINLATNTQAFFEIANGALLSLTQYGGNLGDNVNNLIKVDAGGTFTYFGGLGADLENNAVGGPGAAGGATGSFTSDALVHTLTTAGTYTQASSANREAYSALTLANWNGTNPSSVANALDRIAAKITPIP